VWAGALAACVLEEFYVEYLGNVWEVHVETRIARLISEHHESARASNPVIQGQDAYWVERQAIGPRESIHVLLRHRSGDEVARIEPFDWLGEVSTQNTPRNLLSGGSQLVWMVGDATIASYELATGNHLVVYRSLRTSGSFALDSQYVYWMQRTSDFSENGVMRGSRTRPSP
jgi:hypothetical protein